MANQQAPIQVKAIRKGYYNDRIRDRGDTFACLCDADIGSWMQRLDGKPGKNRRLTKAQERANTRAKIAAAKERGQSTSSTLKELGEQTEGQIDASVGAAIDVRVDV